MVFCDFYPGPMTEAADLRVALENLWLNDCSFSFDAVHSQALGFGFRCGFLGLLHMQIIQERIERESGIDVVQTAPTVTYEVLLKDREVIRIDSPSELPDMSKVEEIREPIIHTNLIVPPTPSADHAVGEDGRASTKDRYLSPTGHAHYEFPCRDDYDFYDRLKAATHGTDDGLRVERLPPDELVKMDILVNSTPVDACRSRARERPTGRARADPPAPQGNLATFIRHSMQRRSQQGPRPRDHQALRKDVTAKCYGGDVSRKASC